MILSSEYIFSIDPSARYAEISVQNTSKSDAEKTRQNEFLMEQIVASSDNVSVQNHIQEKEQYDSTVQNGQMLIAGCLLIFLLILMGAVSLSASVKLHFSFRSYLFMRAIGATDTILWKLIHSDTLVPVMNGWPVFCCLLFFLCSRCPTLSISLFIICIL